MNNKKLYKVIINDISKIIKKQLNENSNDPYFNYAIKDFDGWISNLEYDDFGTFDSVEEAMYVIKQFKRKLKYKCKTRTVKLDGEDRTIYYLTGQDPSGDTGTIIIEPFFAYGRNPNWEKGDESDYYRNFR